MIRTRPGRGGRPSQSMEPGSAKKGAPNGPCNNICRPPVLVAQENRSRSRVVRVTRYNVAHLPCSGGPGVGSPSSGGVGKPQSPPWIPLASSRAALPAGPIAGRLSNSSPPPPQRTTLAACPATFPACSISDAKSHESRIANIRDFSSKLGRLNLPLRLPLIFAWSHVPGAAGGNTFYDLPP